MTSMLGVCAAFAMALAPAGASRSKEASEPEHAEEAAAATRQASTGTEAQPGNGPAEGVELDPAVHPRLVLAGAATVGPHAFGNEECGLDPPLCERGGRFLGLGGTIELRLRLWRMMYLHARGLAAGNILPNKPVFGGVVLPGLGLGLYGKRVFARVEYLVVWALGSGRFEPPLHAEASASAEWGHHAGLISAGMRHPLTSRLHGEAWAGMTVGPRERRVVKDTEEERLLLSFLVGLGISYDVLR